MIAADNGGDEVVLLSGGNPQIAKADGDEPVQAYIAAMPEWKHDVGRWLDDVIVGAVPGVRKAVRWNTPFYGVEDQGWFVSFHCFTKYVKVTFHNGASLDPPPPVGSKHPDVRYLHINEDDIHRDGVHEEGALDEEQFVSWMRQAASKPGEFLF